MSTYLFAVPISPGKTDELKGYYREINEQHIAEYKASMQRAGIKSEQRWIQHNPNGTDIVVLSWDTDNPRKAFETRLNSQDPFDKWLREKVINGCLCITDTRRFLPLNELVTDITLQPSSERVHVQTGKR